MEKYFWLLGASRSGHNFVKNNIISWLNDELTYINLEGVTPIDFYKRLEKNSNIITLEENKLLSPIRGLDQITIEGDGIYNNSIKVICLRDLLNWYTSLYFFYQLRDNIKNNHRKVKNLKRENILFISQKTSELEKNPDMWFINDMMDKDEFYIRLVGISPLSNTFCKIS